MELYTMSKKELVRLDYVKKVIEKRVTQGQAALDLGLSVRQVQRSIKHYKLSGCTGLISKKRGRVSNNIIANTTKIAVLNVIAKDYHDFGPTLALEKMSLNHSCSVSVETIRKWMIEAQLWVPRKYKLKRAYQPRYRRNCYGELVQIDGSRHQWFEDRGPKCTLLVYIDDATSKLMELRFVESESMHTYFLATKSYLSKHGRPITFYSDKFSVFRNVNTKAAEKGQSTQFGRALQELDIQLLCANSCQAKGRVERANKTLQDRLVKELRLRNISTVTAANAYLSEFTVEYNARFAKAPMLEQDVHRPLLNNMIPDEILCFKAMRTVSQNLTFQHNRQTFLLNDTLQNRELRRKQVVLHDYPEGHIKVFYNNKEIQFRMIYDKVLSLAQGEIISDNEYLSEVLNYVRERQKLMPVVKRTHSAPSRTHLRHMVN
jgi:hypothetical protein